MPNQPITKRKPWHEPKRKAFARKTDNSKFYNSRAWRNFRKSRLLEEPLCRECKRNNKITEATVLDHIKRIEDGGEKLSKQNTQPLCKSCHNSKSGREAHGFKMNY